MISLTSFLFVVLLAAVENAIIPTDDMDNRILQGEDASITEFPSMVYLTIDHPSMGAYSQCGGTIISERWILTAAHCVHKAAAYNVKMRVGSEHKEYGGSVHRASRIIVHEKYIMKKKGDGVLDAQNDIALVKAEDSFPLNGFTVEVASLAFENEDILPGSIVTVAGWGRITETDSARVLQKTYLPVISRKECRISMFPITIDGRNLCAQYPLGWTRTCRGDSGGPVFHNGKVVGINSLSTICRILQDAPNVSTRVAYFRSWIKQNTGI